MLCILVQLKLFETSLIIPLRQNLHTALNHDMFFWNTKIN